MRLASRMKYELNALSEQTVVTSPYTASNCASASAALPSRERREHTRKAWVRVCVASRENSPPPLLLSSSERAVTSRDARRLRRLGTLRDCAKRRSRGGAPHPRTLHFTTNHYTYSTLHYNHRTSRAPRTMHCITLYRITVQYIVQYSTVHCMTIHYNHRASRAPRASHCIAHYVHS